MASKKKAKHEAPSTPPATDPQQPPQNAGDSGTDKAPGISKSPKKRSTRASPTDTPKRRKKTAQVGEDVQPFDPTARIPKSPPPPLADVVYQFRITLRELHPPVWRRIRVRDCTLHKLHQYIQAVMGWTDTHLHLFDIDGYHFSNPAMVEDFYDFDSTVVNLSQVLPRSSKRFAFDYTYDYGDNWDHEIALEARLTAEPGTEYPVCLEGARACPPEDCGGVWGYMKMLDVIRDPEDEDHMDLLEWIGEDFDPEHFDPQQATMAMHRDLSSLWDI